MDHIETKVKNAAEWTDKGMQVIGECVNIGNQRVMLICVFKY